VQETSKSNSTNGHIDRGLGNGNFNTIKKLFKRIMIQEIRKKYFTGNHFNARRIRIVKWLKKTGKPGYDKCSLL
jgi:hypothetical protein